MKKTIIAIIVILLVVLGIYVVKHGSSTTSEQQAMVSPTPLEPTPTPTPEDKTKTVIGKSVEGRDIVAYHFGEGAEELLFVGGINGGYEWNTALVANQLMDYLKQNPDIIPSNLTVTVIPVLNPDGLAKVIGATTTQTDFTKANVATSQDTQVAGRFNANTVDLNRNFDCDWQAQGKWQTKTVSGGTSAFSEPESQAIKAYVESHPPKAVVVWYSSAGGVFASSCHNGVSNETSALTQTFAKASGYPAHETFDFYEITGDMVNWLAKQNVPAISVLLTNHVDTEWTKNQKGIDAVLKAYTK